MEYTKYELSNLDRTIAKFVLPRLKEFRKVANGYPLSLEKFEDWEKILDKMIQSFELVLDDSDSDFDVKASYVVKDGKKVIKDESSTDEAKAYIDYFKEKEKKIQEGLDLFAKYFQELWI